MPYREFCCRAGGSNSNAGTRKGDGTEPSTSPNFTYASGSWVASTGVFTVASGNPSADGVVAGDYASVFVDGSTTTGFVGLVTAVTSTTITVSLTTRMGTAPTDGTSNRTLIIGGAWQGPNGSSGFPINLITNSLGGSLIPRVNYKNDAVYSITSGISCPAAGAGVIHQGYTSTYGDYGKATIQGPDSGASFVLVTTTASNGVALIDLIFDRNGSTGAASNVSVAFQNVIRCVSSRSRGSGFVTSSTTLFVECESFGNNLSNTSGRAGFENSSSGAIFLRCIAHDNTGSNSHGFRTTLGSALFDCISDTNGGRGFDHTTQRHGIFVGCNAYNNTSDGLRLGGGSVYGVVVQNCNFVKNGGWGINVTTQQPIEIMNCGFGTGTQANTSGTVSTSDSVTEVDSVSYSSNLTPWVDPANGDFRISLDAAKNAGRGAFLQTASNYAGTISYVDIGAAQSQASGGGARSVNIRGGADQ